jgi:2-C-methyl-D-erythritol 4-phosphate cytidylyltransferase/2-C-methyl-D-erythritol 2,4-cyclodiphosphate synthase
VTPDQIEAPGDRIDATRPRKKVAALVVAAGRGERAGDPHHGPKQYRAIGERAVIAHTLSGLLSYPGIDSVTVVIHGDDLALFENATVDLQPVDRTRLATVTGGATRQASVRLGLEALVADPPDHVLIHDAVRPFLDMGLLDRVTRALDAGAPAVLPVLAVTDTLKAANAEGRVTATVPRDGLYAAQTPQAFEYPAILEAHRQAARHGGVFTDDASIAEWAGIPVRIVTGSPQNIKLTLKEDIVAADERLRQLEAALPDVRTGNGYDVHRLVPGDGVTLCGVFIPHDQTLDGHSDADVGYHALTDALLATCGAGDIGDHFPPSDPQWKGVASRIFLSRAAEIVRSHGGRITHADISLICEAPRVGPHRQAMREAMARDLDVDVTRCSVKATTNETIGFVGRREGIAAIATATVVYGRSGG